MESIQTNSQVQEDFTNREKKLAEDFGVEPKTVRLITEIVQHRLDELQETEVDNSLED